MIPPRDATLGPKVSAACDKYETTTCDASRVGVSCALTTATRFDSSTENSARASCAQALLSSPHVTLETTVSSFWAPLSRHELQGQQPVFGFVFFVSPLLKLVIAISTDRSIRSLTSLNKGAHLRVTWSR